MNPKDRMGAKKPNLSVLPFAPLLEVIPALYEGRRKYGPWNWRTEEVSETIYADAAIRHLMQFIAGEDIDPDSGVHHIAKAIAGLLVVRDAQLHGCSIDDRMVDQNLGIAKIMGQLAGVNERYPEPVESTLPPRDQGITGGETMTEEDAEKLAEYLGLRGVVNKWSLTAAGDGSYELKEGDVGKTIRLRDGRDGTIKRTREISNWPFVIEVPNQFKPHMMDSYSVNKFGQYSAEAGSNEVDPTLFDDFDVVKVFHS